MLADRVKNLKVSPTRRYSRLAEQVESNGTKVLKLSIGAPDLPAPELFFSSISSYPNKVMGYANSQGLKEMLQSQQKYYSKNNISFDLSEIFITSGAVEGIYFSLMSICDTSDNIIMLEPYYTNYGLITDVLGIDIHPVTTSIETNYSIPSLDILEKAVDGKTKAILISNPCNPTGRVYTKEELESIVQLAKKHNLVIISDEVYREFVFIDRKFISLYDFEEIREQLILLDSASKKYAVCAARIGSVATKNKEIASSVLKLCQMRLSAPTLEQYAVSSLINLDDSYFKNVSETYINRKNALENSLSKLPDIRFSTPEGAFYTLVTLPVEDADDFVVWTLTNFSDNNQTVLVTPSQDFYCTEGLGKNEIRISYCVNENVLIRSVELLDKALTVYPKSKRNRPEAHSCTVSMDYRAY